jgi:hypothetical protein
MAKRKRETKCQRILRESLAARDRRISNMLTVVLDSDPGNYADWLLENYPEVANELLYLAERLESSSSGKSIWDPQSDLQIWNRKKESGAVT